MFLPALLVADDYYWVGGQGNWSDLNHWKLENGQTPNEVPDANDNVIFNENSFNFKFDTVFIFTGNPTCKSMIWENLVDTVFLFGGINTVSFDIFGSVTMHPKVRNKYYGKITFLSNESGNTITCANCNFSGDLIFEGSGEWILQDTLIVLDTNDWQYRFFETNYNIGNAFSIMHNNGHLDVSEQTIIGGTFSTGSNNICELDMGNAHAYFLNAWTLNGQNLEFNGTNSQIFLGNGMYNLYGDEVYYHDVEFFKEVGFLSNVGIKTVYRKVYFASGGSLLGNNTPGIEGSFTIDTLLFNGQGTIPSSASPVQISGPGHNIYYTRIDTLAAQFNVSDGDFHRIDFNALNWGNLYEGEPDIFKGENNIIDTCNFFNNSAKFIGINTVTGILYFGRESIIYAMNENQNSINHAVFTANGYFMGNNNLAKLSLGSGYQYCFQADSLIQPGSYYSNSYIQTIGQLEVNGSCNLGPTIFNSDFKPIRAIINYTGGPLSTDYLQVSDIWNIGSSMTVTNGIDAGNNEGIIFSDPLLSRDLYWVNGQGEWSNSNHWSLSSGGTGNQCPPTILDNVFFDSGSGFSFTEDSVFVNLPQIHCNNMTWVDGFTDIVKVISCDTVFRTYFNDTIHVWQSDTTLLSFDTCALHIHGSIELDTMLVFQFNGDIHFESENDTDYEIIDIEWLGNRFNLLNKAIFNGKGGKWKIEENKGFYNLEDTVNFRMGELLLACDRVEVLNFISIDTLPRKLTFEDDLLFVVHQWGSDAWNINASPGLNGGDPLFSFDAGRSTIRLLGDKWVMSYPLGQSNIRTYGGELAYHNIEFGFTELTDGENCMIKSESKCTYNLIDTYYDKIQITGTGAIDTLTWYPTSNNSNLNDSYDVNFVMAYGTNNALFGSQNIDTALFYKEAIISGNHNIGYLKTDRTLYIDSVNIIDTAILMGNTEIFGNNDFSQLVLGQNCRFVFENTGTTVITNDFVVEGYCDGPIRLQSDIPANVASILYKAQNPGNPEYTANYVSIQDIEMIEWENNQYIANNSVDLGNNFNWIFNESGNETYYWINGTGDWGDWQHWSHTSGGPPIAEQCIPRETNTVVFDHNSFNLFKDTVNVNISNIFCKNMYWKYDPSQYNPVFIGNDTTSLFIYGSMMLNYNIIYLFRGEIFFDQYNEPNNLPDTIYSRTNVFLNDVYFQGKDDVIILDDPMILSAADKCILHHLYGDFILNGNGLQTGSFQSGNNSNRIIDMENSTVEVNYVGGRAFWLEGQNLELYAEHSTIINESTSGTIAILNGNSFTFNDIIVNGSVDSLFNKNNSIDYRVIRINGSSSLVTGNYSADSVYLKGLNTGIFKNGNIDVVIVDGKNGSINDFNNINKCYFNNIGKIKGNNHINYCEFLDDGTFLGQNIFDTLVLYPGQGNSGNQGNWFYFQVDSTQIINDSLYIRGNQCSNMNISTTPLNSAVPAFIRKDNGSDVSADYLNIYNVGAITTGNVEFYAGANSTPLPDPLNPPPGWIFDNAQGYIPGFNGRTERFCASDTYYIDAGDFNGGPSTQYLWNGELGDMLYPITEPGTYNISVIYNEDCIVDDFIIIEEDIPPEAIIQEGPYCEGNSIEVDVTPQQGDYSYVWWNGETTPSIVADINYSGNISVTVTDILTNCNANPEQDIVVKPTPNPESALGDDETIKFGETITLDAGEGDLYDWGSDPFYPIENPDQRFIVVSGYPEPVEYNVYVEMDGCASEGYKIISMYPQSKLGVPTAFTPNGDGLNDVLYVEGSGFENMVFQIYNRFGELIFETTDKTIGWDGTVNGIKQEIEVYTYYLEVVFVDKSIVQESGNITLLR